MYYNREFAQRLEAYIECKRYNQALYTHLSKSLPVRDRQLPQRMAGDENRALRALQLEYYLLSGDTLPGKAPKIQGSAAENLRFAYTRELECAENFAHEAEQSGDAESKQLFLNLKQNALRHCRVLKSLSRRVLGG